MTLFAYPLLHFENNAAMVLEPVASEGIPNLQVDVIQYCRVMERSLCLGFEVLQAKVMERLSQRSTFTSNGNTYLGTVVVDMACKNCTGSGSQASFGHGLVRTEVLKRSKIH